MKSLHSVSLRLSTVKSWAVGRKCCILIILFGSKTIVVIFADDVSVVDCIHTPRCHSMCPASAQKH